MVRPSLTALVLLVACGDDGAASSETDTATGPTSTGPSSSSASTNPPTTSAATTDDTTTSPTEPTTSVTSVGPTTDEESSESSSGGELIGEPFVYVGGYGNEIRVFELDLESGAMTQVGDPVDAGTNPSYLAVDPDAQYLFAVNETGDFGGEATGAVASFTIDQTTGALTFVDRVSSEGQGPAHVATDRSGAWVLVATYSGGTAAVIPIEAGGALGDAVDVQMHGGGAQSHMIMPDRANAFVFVPNKGLDAVAQYAFDETTGQLTPNAVPSISTAGGAGPRHMDFHPVLPVAYVINELDSTMAVYAYDANLGQLTEIQVLSTLDGGSGGNTGADVHVHPSGDFVYGSNRGDDSIVTFAADPTDGTLELVGHVSTGGETPRNFEVAPDGSLMLVANQNSDSIVAFSIDEATGLPTATGETASAPSPSFVGIVYLPGRG